MNTPQSWNTLDEAAEYLSAETGEKWTSRKVLDLALKNIRHTSNGQPSPSWIKAAPPRATKFVRCRFDLQAKQVATSPFVPLMVSRWQTISLYQAHIGELLACGETLVGIASRPDDPDGEEGIFVIIDPELIVTTAMLGIGGIALKGVAAKLIGARADQNAIEKKTSPPAAPEKWSRGLKLVAWECASAILADSKDLSASGLEDRMQRDSRVTVSGEILQFEKADASLKRGEDEVKISTLANWVTALKKVITQNP